MPNKDNTTRFPSEELLEYGKLSPQEQIHKIGEIIEAFRKFWDSEPDEEWFGAVMGGIVLSPEILYIMARRTW